MRRREILMAVCVLGMIPLASIGQQRGTAPLVGLLISETLSGQATRMEALRAGLRELGYSVESRTISFEIRAADGDYDRLPKLAAELVGIKVDVLVAFGSKAVVAARGATATIPIVVPSSGDPVDLGVVIGLSRPGGSVTGIAIFAPELTAKWLGLLKEAVPRIVRGGLLRNSANPYRMTTNEAVRASAKSLKLELHAFDVRAPKDFSGAFAAMAKARIDAVRAGDQFEDRQGPRRHDSAIRVRARRPGHRMKGSNRI
jgi:putative ABC transport system substrate-binding protein